MFLSKQIGIESASWLTNTYLKHLVLNKHLPEAFGGYLTNIYLKYSDILQKAPLESTWVEGIKPQ